MDIIQKILLNEHNCMYNEPKIEIFLQGMRNDSAYPSFSSIEKSGKVNSPVMQFLIFLSVSIPFLWCSAQLNPKELESRYIAAVKNKNFDEAQTLLTQLRNLMGILLLQIRLSTSIFTAVCFNAMRDNMLMQSFH